MLEMKALAEATAMIVKEHVAAAVTPLLDRIDALEKRPTEPDNVVILQLVKEEIAKIPPPENGKDADPEQVASLVAEQVERAVAALPVPQDGKSIGVEDVAPLIAEEVGKAVATIPAPRSIKGVIVNREGQAVFTYSDGTTENIGQVAGKDGADVDWPTVEMKLREMVDAIPRPKDGKDGRDGFSLEDFDIKRGDDQRTLIFCFEGKEAGYEYEMTLQHPIYCGVFKEGQDYMPGDMVTWGGSLWHCNEATKEKPEAGPWTLAVKKGRDGKDGKNG